MLSARMLVLLSLALAPVNSSTQAKPSFAGMWELDTDKSKAAARSTPGISVTAGGRLVLTIKQDAKTLSRTSSQSTVVYELDGKPHQSTQGNGLRTVTAKWVGETVVVEVRVNDSGSEYIDRSTYARDGEWLVISVESSSKSRNTVTRNYFRKLGK